MALRQKVTRNYEADEITLYQAFDDFIEEKRARNLSEKTLHNYRQSFDIFCKFYKFDEDTPISTVNVRHFFKWMNTIKLDGIKPTSINHYLRDLRAFFYWTMDDTRAYLPRFKIEMTVSQEEKPKMFTDEEIEALLIKPRKKDTFVVFRTWAIVNWVLGTGNRASTICEIQVGDIDFKKKEITLRHTKNRKLQIIPLSSSLSTVLKEYIKMWRNGSPSDAWLFPNIEDTQLTTNALRHSFSNYCKDRGVSRTNIHGLRHNFAKAWVQANGNLYQLQTMLGHATLDMTRRYVRLFSEDIKEDFDKFSPLDNIKRKQKRTQTIKKSNYE